MADPRFFERKGPFSLAEIAEATQSVVTPGGDPGMRLFDVASLHSATARDLSFLDNPKYLAAFRKSRAGACFAATGHVQDAPDGMTVLVSARPYKAFGLAARLFYPEPPVVPGIAPSAAVDASAQIGAGCAVGPGAVIGADASLGAGTAVGANAVIGRGVVIGENCRIHENVTITHSILGDRVTVFPGACLGQDGFGFAQDPAVHVTIPQLGRVLIGDDVWIGANTTVDRGAGPDTKIGDGCRIDNQVQIAHNVELGKGCVVAALVGISGSTHLGDHVVVAGQVGFAGHLRVASGVRLAGKSGVTNDIELEGETYGGFPAVPIAEWRRQMASLKRLAKRKGKSDG